MDFLTLETLSTLLSQRKIIRIREFAVDDNTNGLVMAINCESDKMLSLYFTPRKDGDGMSVDFSVR